MVIEFFQFPGIPAIGCAFCGRDPDNPPYGGNISFNVDAETARASRGRLLAELARHGMTDWHELGQVHGTDIVIEPEPCDPLLPDVPLERADGAMTSRPGLGLAIKTADCQPILFCDRRGRHIMAIHCGWRGNRANLPELAVRQFARKYGLSPREIAAVRGPSLGPENAEFINFGAEWGPEFANWHSQGKMDLWRLTRDQLMAAGVPEDQIYGLDICTRANSDSWFSYRRDRHCGRQASLIWIRNRQGT